MRDFDIYGAFGVSDEQVWRNRNACFVYDTETLDYQNVVNIPSDSIFSSQIFSDDREAWQKVSKTRVSVEALFFLILKVGEFLAIDTSPFMKQRIKILMFKEDI